jgi:DNA uptake protein ComE-like DNA-binding protein
MPGNYEGTFMYDSISSTASDRQQTLAIRLGGSHGYRIDGDLASINAELSCAGERAAVAAEQWALQLWACDEPYGGGALSGFKVAEAPIALPAGAETPQLDAVAFAHPPACARDYSMVLVLAGGQRGAFDQVHDFANYPARERFLAPHFAGSVGYRILPEGKLALSAERIGNPRAANNLSGSLALQLWRMAEPYRGGDFTGTLLGSVALGRVHGQSEIEPGEQVVALTGDAGGEGHLVLMLREWTAEGYLTRDYHNCAALERDAATAQPAEAQAPEAAAASAEPERAPSEPARAPSEPTPESAAKPREPERVTQPRLSLQRASAEELVRATGISKKLAADVIKARPFKSFDELTRVRGIGEKTVRKFRDAMTL